MKKLLVRSHITFVIFILSLTISSSTYSHTINDFLSYLYLENVVSCEIETQWVL